MTRLLPLLLLGALLAPLTRPATAQTAIAWPEGDPIWELDVVRPSASSGPDGSGVEIRNVRYRGRMVLKRGHVPILNVKYEAGCNCFRDWQNSEVRFQANTPSSNGIVDAVPGSVATMCDVAPANCTDTNGDGEADVCNDVGSFHGVAVERFEDFLRLTTHMSAGWYRYTMKWEFHADGTIRPRFGFTSTGTSCTQNPRRHHAYWRFDFDIDGAENDYIVERRGEVDIPLGVEGIRSWSLDLPFAGDQTMHDQPLDPANPPSWLVMDADAGLGYSLTPSASDLLTPMNPETGNPALDFFAKEDVVVARYAPDEIADDGFGCEAKFTEEDSNDPIVNGELVTNTDVVLWYRSGVTKPDIDPGHCYESGPILRPVGDWAAQNAVGTEGGVQPAGFVLEEAYPNPFSGQTTLRFSVDQAQRVRLTLYDAVGRAVRTLYEGTPEAGARQTVTLDASELPSGVYTVRLQGESVSGSTRVVVVR